MIREIQKKDLIPSYFELLSQLSGTASEYANADLWNTYLDMKPGIMTFVSIEEGPDWYRPVIGSATVFIESKFLHGGSKVAHIEDVVVDKARRVKGTGKSLIEKCVEYATDVGCYKIILDCEGHNIPFYNKCGFTVDGACMRKNLGD